MDRKYRSSPLPRSPRALRRRADGRGGAFILAAVTSGLLSAPGPAPAGDESALESAGNVLQYLLPVAAGYCAVKQERGREFAAAFAAQAVVVHSLREGLGETDLNQRPSGSYHGFPSAHTAAAVFGATNLARKCFPDRPDLGALAYGLALVVGVSRLEADRHDATQVGAGALIGYFANGVTLSVEPGRIGLGYSFRF